MPVRAIVFTESELRPEHRLLADVSRPPFAFYIEDPGQIKSASCTATAGAGRSLKINQRRQILLGFCRARLLDKESPHLTPPHAGTVADRPFL